MHTQQHLANEYAQKIKALNAEYEAKLQALYLEFQAQVERQKASASELDPPSTGSSPQNDQPSN